MADANNAAENINTAGSSQTRTDEASHVTTPGYEHFPARDPARKPM